MHAYLDRRTSSGKTVGDIVFAPLMAQGIELMVVDVGARNGMVELPASYAGHANYIGFEPDEVEYEKLRMHNTDAAKIGYVPPRWKSETFHNCALWRNAEMRTFYITDGASACTLMGETNPAMTGRMFGDHPDPQSQKFHYERYTRIKSTVAIECRRLDEMIGPDVKIDYLKLDVEGAELAVLEGAEALFQANNVLFIKTEFVLTPYYEVHPVLGYQHVFLHERGFRLLNFDFPKMRYTRDLTSIPPLNDRRLIYAGDAYFALDPDRNALPPIDLHRMGVILIALGFTSFGMSVLRDANYIQESVLKEIEVALSRVALHRRLPHTWQRFRTLLGARLYHLGYHLGRRVRVWRGG